jgi:hypothetical protein
MYHSFFNGSNIGADDGEGIEESSVAGEEDEQKKYRKPKRLAAPREMAGWPQCRRRRALVVAWGCPVRRSGPLTSAHGPVFVRRAYVRELGEIIFIRPDAIT